MYFWLPDRVDTMRVTRNIALQTKNKFEGLGDIIHRVMGQLPVPIAGVLYRVHLLSVQQLYEYRHIVHCTFRTPMFTKFGILLNLGAPPIPGQGQGVTCGRSRIYGASGGAGGDLVIQ
jgi:hypothetical protein